MDTPNAPTSPGRPPIHGKAMRQTAVMMTKEMMDWLNQQPEGKSETVRKLVEQAMKAQK